MPESEAFANLVSEVRLFIQEQAACDLPCPVSLLEALRDAEQILNDEEG